MAKVLNNLIGIIGIFYIAGRVTYYGIVQYLILIKGKTQKQAEIIANNHKIIFDWMVLMGILLIILACIALIANFIQIQESQFGLRVIFSLVGIFMPSVNFDDQAVLIFTIECIFLILFALYLISERKQKS
ncbi:hypothetical protein ACWCL1_04735 [Ligilactobacillus sp. LYQ135]